MFKLKGDYDSYESKTLRLPTKLVAELSKQAEAEHISFNKAVAQCIEYALSDMAETSSEDK